MSKQSYYLKRCPFCGGQAKTEKSSDGKYRARCIFCLCRTTAYESKLEAVYRWNCRTEAYKVKWHLCEKSLPTNSNPCLVICRRWSRIENAWKRGTPQILRYLPDEQRWDIVGIVDVQAWAELPEFTENELEEI